MRTYEMMVISRADVEENATPALIEKISGIVTGNGGSVEKVEPSKKQRFAYEINDLREGVYTLMYFKGEPKVADELNRVLKITDEVIRFLIVRPEA